MKRDLLFMAMLRRLAGVWGGFLVCCMLWTASVGAWSPWRSWSMAPVRGFPSARAVLSSCLVGLWAARAQSEPYTWNVEGTVSFPPMAGCSPRGCAARACGVKQALHLCKGPVYTGNVVSLFKTRTWGIAWEWLSGGGVNRYVLSAQKNGGLVYTPLAEPLPQEAQGDIVEQRLENGDIQLNLRTKGICTVEAWPRSSWLRVTVDGVQYDIINMQKSWLDDLIAQKRSMIKELSDETK